MEHYCGLKFNYYNTETNLPSTQNFENKGKKEILLFCQLAFWVTSNDFVKNYLPNFETINYIIMQTLENLVRHSMFLGCN